MNETEFLVHHWGFIWLEFHWTKRLSTGNRVFQSSSIFETGFFFHTSFRVDRSWRSVKTTPVVVERHLSRVGCAWVDEQMQKRTKHSLHLREQLIMKPRVRACRLQWWFIIKEYRMAFNSCAKNDLKVWRKERWTRNFRITGECIDCLRPFLLI